MNYIDKIKFNKIVSLNYTEQEIMEVVKSAEQGNIPARQSLILHNQLVLSKKLDKLLNKI